MPYWLAFALSALAVWRITHLLTREDGPFDLVAKLQRALARTALRRLIDCFKCLSVWVAIPFTFFVAEQWVERVVVWLALSGAAILLEEQITGPLIVEQGADDELLRQDEATSAGGPAPDEHRPSG